MRERERERERREGGRKRGREGEKQRDRGREGGREGRKRYSKDLFGCGQACVCVFARTRHVCVTVLVYVSICVLKEASVYVCLCVKI